jgi:hypothetical protein
VTSVSACSESRPDKSPDPRHHPPHDRRQRIIQPHDEIGTWPHKLTSYRRIAVDDPRLACYRFGNARADDPLRKCRPIGTMREGIDFCMRNTKLLLQRQGHSGLAGATRPDDRDPPHLDCHEL